jgi:hypothetical protein
MHPAPRIPLAHRYFTGLAEAAFQGRLGVADPPLVEYIARLLVRFVHIDALYRIRDLVGRRLDEVVEMVGEAEQRVGNARREVHRQIGDFSLFWTGIYPETLKRLHSVERKDHFVDYCQQGKRSYYIASTYRDGEYADESSVLERISQQFELCAYGLNEIRRQWEQEAEESPLPRPLLIE